MISLDQATALTLARAAPLGLERIALEAAAGRILAAHVRARTCAPPRDVSAMDGYAVRDDDVRVQAGHPIPALEIVGEARAGGAWRGLIGPGQCVRIFTGAPMPRGAGRVIMQEDAARAGDHITLLNPVSDKCHVRERGSDFHTGDVLVPAGRRLTAAALVAAAAADEATVSVWRRPKVAILSTGDELRAPGSAAETLAGTPESVSFGVAAMIETWGGEVIAHRRLADDLGVLRAAARQAVEIADLVVVTGGASVGDHDLAKPMFEPLELIFSKVDMRPGKPVWLGRSDGTLVLGLPGNPVAAVVTARLFLAPLVAGMAGRNPAEALAWRRANLANPLAASGPREAMLCGRGAPVEALASQDSSRQKSLGEADLLIRRRAGADALNAGEAVDVLDL